MSQSNEIVVPNYEGQDSAVIGTSKATGKRKEYNKRSVVWQHFHEFVDSEGKKKCKCNYCDRAYNCASKSCGTSTLLTHMKTCSSNPFNKTPSQSQLAYDTSKNVETGVEKVNLMSWKFDQQVGKRIAKIVKSALYELFNEYRRIHSNNVESSSSTLVLSSSTSFPSSLEVSGEVDPLMRMREKNLAELKRRKASSSVVRDTKSELDRYLTEDDEEDKRILEDPSFNILDWWKKKSPALPILSLLARDILAIPVSTVASESVFSTGGRILDSFRSSLTPKIVQGLICTQNWIRPHESSIYVEENVEELERIEQELKESMAESSVINDV